MPSKVLLVFCDGTGMDGVLANDITGNSVRTANNKSLPPQYSGNALRLSRAVKPKTSDGRDQIVLYQSGVGTEADFSGDAGAEGIVQAISGVVVASKIRDAYVFIAQNYEDGDEICIFGFSRGSYTARKLSGLIDKIGLLETEKLGSFFKVWKELVDGKTPSVTGRRTRIKCVGVWDTVGSVSNTIDALSIKDTDLPSTIDFALHGMSLHENREPFLPTLWTTPSSGLSLATGGQPQVLKQIWFPGSHPDVGGGYEPRELADISLFWMAGEVTGFINLDLEFLRRSAQSSPDPWGTTPPHNEYGDESFGEKILIHEKTRLESGQITDTSIFHSSLLVSPTHLKNSSSMVTLDTLKKQFGSNWQPKLAELNEFEQVCKQHWGNSPKVGNSIAVPIHFESPLDLFGK